MSDSRMLSLPIVIRFDVFKDTGLSHAVNRPEYPGDSLVRIKPRWPIQLFAHSTQFLVLLVAHYQWTPLGGGC